MFIELAEVRVRVRDGFSKTELLRYRTLVNLNNIVAITSAGHTKAGGKTSDIETLTMVQTISKGDLYVIQSMEEIQELIAEARGTLCGTIKQVEPMVKEVENNL